MSEPKTIAAADLRALSATAAALPRLRKNLNLHPTLEDPVQRLFNALAPGTYVRPHRHAAWELMLAVRGAFSILIFDDAGRVAERIELSATQGALALEIPAQTWHAAVVMVPDTVMFEVKPGPYRAVAEQDCAAWAPAEGTAAADLLERWYRTARAGEQAPAW